MMEGVLIVPSQSDHLEVDELEENMARLGRYGEFSEVPVANSARSVYFVSPSGAGDADGSTAANALVGTYDVVSSNATAGVQDVFVFLYEASGYDFDGATGGLAMSVSGVKIFGLGGTMSVIVNGNAAAVAVITVTAQNTEIAGFQSNEASNTVETIVISQDYCHVHHMLFVNTMENGIRCSEDYMHVFKCLFVGITNDGIELTSGHHNEIYENYFEGIGDNAVHLNGDGVDRNLVYDNKINGRNGTTDYAIKIVLGDENMVSDNWMVEVGTWPISDTGSDNGWVDNHYGGALTGSHEITQALDQVETTITGLDDLDLWKEGHLYISIDATTVVDNITMTVYMKEKIDGSTYKIIKLDTWNVPAGDVQHPVLDWGYEGGPDKVRCTVICDGDLGAARTIYWRLKLI